MARPRGEATGLGRLAGTVDGIGGTGGEHRAPAWTVLASAAVLVGLWAVVLLGLGSVLEIGAWYGRALTISTAAIGVACLLSLWRPAHRTAAAFGGVVAGGLCWTWWFSASARAASWWNDPGDMITQLWTRIDRGSAPLDPDGPLEDVLLLVVLLVAAVAVLLFVGLGHALAAGAFTALILLVPSGVTGFSVGGTALLAAGVLLALLAWLGSPVPSGAGILAAGAAVAIAAAAMAVAPMTRDRVWNTALMLSPISATVPDVTVVLAEDLRRGSRASAFTYSGARPGPHRFVLATLADFEGGRWLPQSELDAEGASVAEARRAASIPPRAMPDAGGTPMNPVTVTIDGLISSWLPLPQSATRVTTDEEAPDLAQWRWTADSNTARSEAAVTRDGDTYRAESIPLLAEELMPHVLGEEGSLDMEAFFSEESLRLLTGTEDVPERLTPYLALPKGMPSEISDAAQRIAGSAENRLLVGQALQDWFRSGDFTYDEEAPYAPGTDPSDPYAVMVGLLSERRGFCVHYASTFAVMARELGVPTRLAIGYAARTFRSDEETVVRGKDLHAWPEIYVDGTGWIAFEPTPGGAGLRADTNRRVPSTPRDRPNATPTRTPEPRPERPSSEPDRPENAGNEDPASGGGGATVGSATWWVAPPLAALLLLLPAGTRRLRRVRRVRAIRRGERPAQQAWAEFVDSAHDLGLLDARGIDPPRARTPEALVEHLVARDVLSGEPAAAAKRLGEGASAERYGGVEASGAAVLEALGAALAALGERADRGSRIRAVLLPRSLFLRPAKR